MAGRIRSLKPEWMEDRKLMKAGLPARVLSVCLILKADDYGRGTWTPEILCHEVFAFESDASRVFREGVARLREIGFFDIYEVHGELYFFIRNWSRHQKVDHPGKARCPAPLEESIVKNGDVLAKDSRGSRAILGFDPDPDPDLDQDHRGRAGAPADAHARVGSSVRDDQTAEPYGPHGPDELATWRFVQSEFSRQRAALPGGGRWKPQRTDYDRLRGVVDWAHAEIPTDPQSAVSEAIRRFLAHSRGKESEGWPFWAFANDPGRWFVSESPENSKTIVQNKPAAHRPAKIPKIEITPDAMTFEEIAELGKTFRWKRGVKT